MPTKFFIRPYKVGSNSAKALSEALNGKRLKLEGSTYRPKAGHVVINWGNSANFNGTMLNPPGSVRRAANKLTTLQALFDAGVSVPAFTTDRADAQSWGHDATVVVRHKLTGHSGEGIQLVEGGAAIPEAPLYTKYVPKKEEYRIHVGRKPNGDYEVIFKQRKARRLDVADADVNWKVRNLAGGFVFAHNDIDVPGAVCNEAILALEALDLDFGAVDIVWNERNSKAYVLEVNSAPGLEGSTVQAYAEFFNNFD